MTNTLSQITQNPTINSNINQVIVEMLSGVKVASGEIYGASKEAIHKSVGFIQEQAPDVISQFCQWKFTEACIWSVYYFLFSVLAISLGIFFYRKINSYASKQDCQQSSLFSYVILSISILISILIFSANVPKCIQTAVKIKIAPKVYVIEYVVDQINGNKNSRR